MSKAPTPKDQAEEYGFTHTGKEVVNYVKVLMRDGKNLFTWALLGGQKKWYEKRDPSVVQALLVYGYSTYGQTHGIPTLLPLVYTFLPLSAQEMREAMEKFTANQRESFLSAMLQHGMNNCTTGSLASVENMLKAGAKAHAEKVIEAYPLATAQDEMLKTVCDSLAASGRKEELNKIFLHFAGKGEASAVQITLDAGADVNANKFRALKAAAGFDRTEMVELLASNGASFEGAIASIAPNSQTNRQLMIKLYKCHDSFNAIAGRSRKTGVILTHTPTASSAAKKLNV